MDYFGASMALDTSATTAYFLATNDDANPMTQSVMQCLLGGGTPTCSPLVQFGTSFECSPFGSLALTGGNAIWVYGDVPPLTTIYRYAFATKTLSSFTVQVPNAAISADNENIYWVGAPDYTVYSLPVAFSTGSMPTALVSLATDPYSVSSDGTNVYYATSSGIAFVAVGGGNQTSLHTPAPTFGDSGVVATSTGIYFQESGGSPSVMNIMGIAGP
jgi:hypothetical protein